MAGLSAAKTSKIVAGGSNRSTLEKKQIRKEEEEK